MKIFKLTEIKIQKYLSHYPKIYALIVGIGIVLFWRGVWHSTDHLYATISYFYTDPSMIVVPTSLWDGFLSLVFGVFILSITGAFTSSFIGNELILSGLRGERRLTERAEADLKDEVSAIGDIKEELVVISKKMEILEKRANNNHINL
jgi:hypothetical protein